MFVARVLTGVFTQGQSDMMVPPPRGNQQAHDRYDSVVDRVDNPNMFVVFHDDQAYADYLITFKWKGVWKAIMYTVIKKASLHCNATSDHMGTYALLCRQTLPILSISGEEGGQYVLSQGHFFVP